MLPIGNNDSRIQGEATCEGEQPFCVALGRAIRDRRDHLGRNQQVLADQAGISRKHLNRLEAGLVDPGIILLNRLAVALETELSALISEAAKKPKPKIKKNRDRADPNP